MVDASVREREADDESAGADATGAVVTFGCRLNAYESEAIARSVAEAGLDNAIVINTCAVTAEAVRQARQTIRRLRRERPNVRIVVTGCAAQTEPETFASMAEVDHVIGNTEKLAPSTYRSLAVDQLERVVVNDIMAVRETAPQLLQSFGSRARAFVQVQNGCDHRCTFCIIPFGRGNSRSVPMGDCVAEVRGLVEQGFREVVLTGVDITSFGADLPGTPTLGTLVTKILRLVPELPRLRLSSIDTIEADDALIRAFAEEDRLMPHLHLSLQSGDDLILKRMKRRHLRHHAVAFCEELRRLRPDMAFGADIIAGFPTETEEAFANSLQLIEDCALEHLHVFPYSPRAGTPAARMPQVPRAVIKERAALLRERGLAFRIAQLSGRIGQTAPVLVERPTTARIPQFHEVVLDQALRPGQETTVRLTGLHNGQLEARVLA